MEEELAQLRQLREKLQKNGGPGFQETNLEDSPTQLFYAHAHQDPDLHFPEEYFGTPNVRVSKEEPAHVKKLTYPNSRQGYIHLGMLTLILEPLFLMLSYLLFR